MLDLVATKILGKYLKGAAPGLLRSRFKKAIPEIVKRMEAKGVTPSTASRKVIVREALFRLIRSVVPSGDISDFLRDAADDAVLERVKVPAEATLTEVVEATSDAYVALVF